MAVDDGVAPTLCSLGIAGVGGHSQPSAPVAVPWAARRMLMPEESAKVTRRMSTTMRGRGVAETSRV